MSAEPQPSYEEPAAENAQLRVMVELLRAELAELKAQLAKDSSDFSKPPSSDGLDKPAPRSLRGKSGRRPGGQKGHPGKTLAQVAEPDERHRHEPACCRGCGVGLAGAAECGVEARQVFDIPPIRVRVIEHQLAKRRCGWGRVTTAQAPAGVAAPVQYGPNVAAIVIYLYAGQFLSRDRTLTPPPPRPAATRTCCENGKPWPTTTNALRARAHGAGPSRPPTLYGT